MSKQFHVQKAFGSLTIHPVGEEIVIVSECTDETGHVIAISRDEARQLHTDLGEMLATFEIADL